MRIISQVKTLALATLISIPTLKSPIYSSEILTKDVFEHSVPPKGTSDSILLANAPSPFVTIKNQNKIAKLVVDLNQNVLYKYDESGSAKEAFLIASGKKSTPTDKGLRIVTHIESYPYKSAPKETKRRKNPRDYGPKIICLNKLNPKTGAQSPTGEFIHGNNNPYSLGKYASKGCMRMDNEVIKRLAQEVKRGDIILIQ